MKQVSFIAATLLYCLFAFSAAAQGKRNDHVRVFIDCNAWCPIQYVKTEITFVDFVPDMFLANIFIQVTGQSTGGDGEEVKMFISGRENFKGRSDTLTFFRNSVDTEEEYRQKFVQRLKLALVPYISKTDIADKITVTVPQKSNEEALNSTANTKDKWNFWVFNARLNGNYGKDDFSKSYRYGGSFSAARTTEKLKLDAGVAYSNNRREIKIDNQTYTYPNDNSTVYGNAVVSINNHWSFGGSASYNRSTFTNSRRSITLKPGIEYNIFPYAQTVKRTITFYYELGPVLNRYIDSSYYDKTQDNLFQHIFSANANFVQKWGNVNLFAAWESFLNPFYVKGRRISGTQVSNFSLGGYIEVRVVKGLNVFMVANADFTKGIYPNIRKADFSTDDILANVRQYPTTNNFYTSAGINYRFGSIYNNVVNPRFNNKGGRQFFF